MTSAIAVDRLTKRATGERVALSQLSFTVAPGEIVGLLGPNGAGKSTTLGILATLLRFDEGSVSIRGHSLPAEAAAISAAALRPHGNLVRIAELGADA
jgi:ABC-type multidrug transport system ATPase subunit